MSDDFDPMAVRAHRSMSEKKAAVREMDAGAESVARDQLRSFVERIERLEEQKAEIADDIKSVYAEAGAHGFDKKVVRRVVAIRKKDQQERMAEESVLATYLSALGME